MGKDITLESEGKSFPAYVATPNGDVKAAVIVIHEVWGLVPHIRDICERLVGQGYAALAPDLFSDTKIEEMVSDELAESLFDPERRSAVQPQMREVMAPIQAPDFAPGATKKLQACYDHLAAKIGDNIAVTGFCFGGTYSFQLAMTEPKLKAAAPFYGHAAFSVEQLGNVKCPVLAFYGEKDENLMQQLPELKEKMQAAGVNFQSIVYPNCGHAFFNDTNRFAHNAEAATDAWQKLLDFLKANLAS